MMIHCYSFELVTRSRGNDAWNAFLSDLQRLHITPTADGPWLCGGAVRRLVNGEIHDTDYDLFFKNAEQAYDFEQTMQKAGAALIRETNTNKTWQIYLPPVEGQLSRAVTIQQITFRYYTTIANVLDSFDFTICQFGWDGTNIHVGQYSLHDTARKRLALHSLTFGVSTLRRLMKYSKQGYTVCSGVLADILQRTIADPESVNPTVISLD